MLICRTLLSQKKRQKKISFSFLLAFTKMENYGSVDLLLSSRAVVGPTPQLRFYRTYMPLTNLRQHIAPEKAYVSQRIQTYFCRLDLNSFALIYVRSTLSGDINHRCRC